METATETRRWSVRIPQPCPWLTANIDRDKYQRARLVKAWRAATVNACFALQLPKDITPVTLFAWINHTRPHAPVRDRLNLAPTMKAVVDALTPSRTTQRNGKTFRTHGYGLLPDDSDRHVLDTRWQLQRSTWDGIELLISTAAPVIEQPSLFDIQPTERS